MIRFVIEQLAYATRGAAKMFRDDPNKWIRGEYHAGYGDDGEGNPTFYRHCAVGAIDNVLGNRQGAYKILDEWMEAPSTASYGGMLEPVIATALFQDLSEVGQEQNEVLSIPPEDILTFTPRWDSLIYYNDAGHTDQCPTEGECEEHYICVANVLDEMADGLDALYEWQSELEGYIPMEPITVGQREEVTVRAAQ